jgi:glycerol-3-phosphate acyltransferase PlsY
VLAAVIVLIIAYALGAIPFALLLTRWGTGVDVRRVGSGNPGAANVWRSTGPARGLAVLILDGAKGAAAVLIARAAGLGSEWQAVAGLAAILGHVFSPWLRFHGGKGVAATAGVFLVLTPIAWGVALVVFAIVAGLTRFVSLGSILGAIALAVSVVALREPPSVIAGTVVAAVVIVWRHRENIARLRRGTELRVAAADVRGEHAVTGQSDGDRDSGH